MPDYDDYLEASARHASGPNANDLREFFRERRMRDMGGKAARSAVDFLPDGADAYPAYNIAFAVIISRRRPDKAKPLSGIRT
ncbi:hypothetical protein ACNKHK_03220 [Shigella flexneri]